MQLTDMLTITSIKVPLDATNKDDAIKEMVDLLASQKMLRDRNDALDAVTRREAVRSTGVGHGFAIPHAKTKAVDKLRLAIGKTKTPMDFDSIDALPVTIIVLLLSPADQTGPHIQAIARISRLMTDQQARDALWKSQSPQEILELITAHQNKAPR